MESSLGIFQVTDGSRDTHAEFHASKRDPLQEFMTLKLQVFGVLRCKLQKWMKPHGRTPGFGTLKDLQIEESG
jgi:hypothetical protein